MKGATTLSDWCVTEAAFQSTLPMKGATRLQKRPCDMGLVSIHAPNEGSDHALRIGSITVDCFNPRSQ